MKKLLVATLTLLLTFTILSGIAALIGSTFSLAPKAFGVVIEPGWAEIRQEKPVLRCHCPDEADECSCEHEAF